MKSNEKMSRKSAAADKNNQKHKVIGPADISDCLCFTLSFWTSADVTVNHDADRIHMEMKAT